MPKPPSKRPPDERRHVRRSLVELTAVASRVVDDDLPETAPGPIAAAIEGSPRREVAAEAPGTIAAPTNKARVAEAEAANAAASASDELQTSDSSAELVVKIAKEFQARALEDFGASMTAALNYAKDFVETRARASGASEGRSRSKDQIVAGLGAAAQYRAESFELAKANVEFALDYVRELTRTGTPAEFVELSSAHVRQQCELILKQRSVLNSFAKAITKSGAD
jgi:hypothetical protein